MKILMISPAYPPHPEVGAVRAGNLVRAFLARGHPVILLTHRPPGLADVVAEPGLRVIPVTVGESLPRRLRRWLPGRPTAPDSGDGAGAGWEARDRRRNRVSFRRTVLALLSTPDIDRHLVGPFVRAAREVLRRESADLLFTTAPPYSTHLAGLTLRRRTGIPWIAEFRDPWHHPQSTRPAFQDPVSRRIDAILERRVLRHADAIVAVTEGSRAFIRAKVPPDRRGSVLLARNGVPDWPGQESPGTRSGPFTIVYTGSLYMGRNPLRFFEGVARLLAERGLGPSQIRVRFVGGSHEFRGMPLAALVDRLGLTGVVCLEPARPHHLMPALLREADALLLFAQQQPLQVPNKLYEYLAVGVPILAFVDREGESARLLSEVGRSEQLADPEATEVAAAIARLMDEAPMEASGAAARALEGLRTEAQLRQLVAELEQRFGDDSNVERNNLQSGRSR
jgi:glycosyltransferase involved in cell wall biosynthesis